MKIDAGVVAVTGASGFIGGYLISDLAKAGYTPVSLSREKNGEQNGGYSYDGLKRSLQGVDAVVHLAGRRMTREDDPMNLAPFWRPNVAVIADLVAASRACGVRKIILASTIAVYQPSTGATRREDSPTRPVNAYGLSKLMAEAHLEMLARGEGLAAVSLRLAAVYGHGEKGTPALMKFVSQACAGETLILSGNPAHQIDQIYVRDAVSAIVSALRTETLASVCNVGGGRAHTVAEIAETVNKVFGNVGGIDYIGQRNELAPRTVMDLSTAKSDMGWSPAYGLYEGLEDFRRTRTGAR